MKSIFETCTPRKELLDGTFNPEIFTAGLNPVIKYYRTGESKIDSIYLDAQAFFTQATYPTKGLVETISNVFRRINGDGFAPATQRLETAFGGGKTHTLIACTHIAFKGKELKNCMQGILDDEWLPEPGSVSVVGIAGDQLDLFRSIGEKRVPHTLWGEIAFQIGGETLYDKVRAEAESMSAPAEGYFQTVLGNRKILIMLDELAQYAARMEVAHHNGADQLTAFMMGLIGYLRGQTGIALLVTLAGTANAFSRQTQHLAYLLNQLSGKELKPDDAESIGDRAIQGLTSVVWRDATVHTPVQAYEISSVLSKRLFSHIDTNESRTTADVYSEMYRKNSSTLPEESIRPDFRERMVATYPFHPTFIDYLNLKLSTAENFQGTRGVLRVLALTVRGIWESKQQVFLIHTHHINLRDNGIMNEVFSRTASVDLLNVLNADIGSVDSSKLEGGKSNAEALDTRNPHPDGIPFYEQTWKAVFLNSLVGRDGGFASRIFGLSEAEALLSISTPLTSPSQIRTALAAIANHAFYLCNESGKYFARMEPTINSVLARIRSTVTIEQIQSAVLTVAKKLIAPTSDCIFHLEHNVSAPEHLPDNLDKPILGVVSVHAEKINVMEMMTYKGNQIGRERQNLVFLLVPKTVKVLDEGMQIGMVDQDNEAMNVALLDVNDVARMVIALQQLKKNPTNYGITPQKLQDPEFINRYAERELALTTRISELYNSLYFPSVKDYVEKKEIRVVSSDGGTSFIQTIREVLIKDKELLTGNSISTTDLEQLSKLVFISGDTEKIDFVRRNFLCLRKWPTLESLQVLEVLIRSGVEKGIWMVYRMGDPAKLSPTELYTQKKPVQLNIELLKKDYSLILPLGAKTRNWLEEAVVIDSVKLKETVRQAVATVPAIRVKDIRANVREQMGEVPSEMVINQIGDLLKQQVAYVYTGNPDQQEMPGNLTTGVQATYHLLSDDEVIINPATVVVRNWQHEQNKDLIASGINAAQILYPMLRTLASRYVKGKVTSRIDELDLSGLDIGQSGAKLRISLENADAATMKQLGELFNVVASLAKQGTGTNLYMKIVDPDETCELVKEMRKQG